ncbi:MAG: hypothetical protein K6E16_01195 [Lachnospiraceae bacterium]|nr:hypothetical protein [Lachnospiraceae bacterium]
MNKRMMLKRFLLLSFAFLLFMMLVPASRAKADDPARSLTVIKPQGGVFTYTKTDAAADSDYVLYAVEGIDDADNVLDWDTLTANLAYVDQKTAAGTSLTFEIPQDAVTENGTFYIGDAAANTNYVSGFLTKEDEVWTGDASAFYFSDEALTSACRTEYRLLNDKTTEDIKKILPKSAYLKLQTKKPAINGTGGTYLAIPVNLTWAGPDGVEGFSVDAGVELTFTAAVTFPADSIEGRTGAAWADKFPVPALQVTIKGPEKPAPKPQQYHRILVQSGATATMNGAVVGSAQKGDMITVTWDRPLVAGVFSTDGYEFEKWVITDNAEGTDQPVWVADEEDPTTRIRVGDTDVTVKFIEKKTMEKESGEEEPADRDKVTKVNTLKYPKTSLTMERGSSVANAAIKAAPKNVSPDTLPEIIYVTENKNIVSVDKNGNFYANGVGETVVTAYCGNKKATCKVNVISPTKKVVILDETGMARKDVYNLTDQELAGWNGPANTIRLKAGEKMQLRAQIYPSDSTDIKNVTWSVVGVPSMVQITKGNYDYKRDKNGDLVYKKDNKTLTIQNGVITAKETNAQYYGFALVSATVKKSVINPATGKVTTENLTTMVQVSVDQIIPEKVTNNNDKTHSLSLKKTSCNMVTTEGSNTFDLVVNVSSKKKADAVTENYLIECESTNPDVVSVVSCSDIAQTDKAGKKGSATLRIKANNPGTAYVIVKSRDKAAAIPNVQRCKVTVTRPVTNVSAISGTLKIGKGKINVYDSKNRVYVDSQEDVKILTMRKGSCGTIDTLVTPYDTTDLSKVKISASGGVKIKNGVIYATTLTKPEKGNYAKVTVTCGKLKDTVYVTVTK